MKQGEFTMEQTLVNLKTKDDVTLRGVFFQPEHKPRSGNAVLHIHDWFGSFLDEYNFVYRTAEYLTCEGHCFLAINTRGSGVAWAWPQTLGLDAMSAPKTWMGGAFDLFDDCVQDIQVGIDFLNNEGCPDIVLEGIGLGASKVIHYQSETLNPKVKSIIINNPKDYVGLEMSQQDFEEKLVTAQNILSNERDSNVFVTKLLGYPLCAASYVNIFGPTGRRKGIHWLIGLREEQPHDLDKITSPILVIRPFFDDSILCKFDYLELIKRRVVGRCETIDAHPLYLRSNSWNNPNEALAETISEWVGDVLP